MTGHDPCMERFSNAPLGLMLWNRIAAQQDTAPESSSSSQTVLDMAWSHSSTAAAACLMHVLKGRYCFDIGSFLFDFYSYLVVARCIQQELSAQWFC
jgi:hypothetical protein